MGEQRPVTGTDGDNPITDEQIRELARLGLVPEMRARMARAGSPVARERCAEVWNEEELLTANTVTDEQIRELHDLAVETIAACNAARDTSRTGADARRRALEYLAAAYNARRGHGGKL